MMNKRKRQQLKPSIIDESTINFAHEVLEGLKSKPKHLPSKYFYDEEGRRLMMQIIDLEQFYLHRTESQIIDDTQHEIAAHAVSISPLRIIELGVSSGIKTKKIIKLLYDNRTPFEYIPIDTSKEMLEKAVNELWTEFKGLKIFPTVGDYIDVVNSINEHDHAKKFVFLLGAKIGNFSYNEAKEFLQNLHDSMNTGDLLLLSFDLKKDPDIIYNSITDDNMLNHSLYTNLLKQINEVLNADFSIQKFVHYPVYEPEGGECRNYLISTTNQIVNIRMTNDTIHFKEWESIHMLTSKKYDEEGIVCLSYQTGYIPIAYYYDSNHFVVNALWQTK